MKTKIISVIMALGGLFANCSDNNPKETYLGLQQMSDIKDYIRDIADTSYVSWVWFNAGRQSVYPIDSLRGKLKLFFIDERDRHLLIYFDNETYYLYELSKIVEYDSVRVLLD